MTTLKIQKPVQRSRITHAGLLRLLLLGVILIAFGRTLGAEFVNWDDGQLIYRNENLNPPTWDGLVRHWNPTDPSNVSMYDPLVFTSWWGLAHIAQLNEVDSVGAMMNPLWFHLTNLVVHSLTVWVIFEILRNMGFKQWAAFFGAAVFAIHPLQTEAVAWSTALKDLMCGLFATLSIWRYLVACQSREKRRVFGATESDWNYILALLCFTLSMLAKPSGVVAMPLVAALLLFWYRIPLKPQLLRLASWGGIALLFVLIAKTVQSSVAVPVPFLPRPLIAADALAFYLYKIALPINLVMDYGRAPLTLLSKQGWDNPLRWTWIVPLAIAGIIAISRRRYLAVAGICLVIGVLPVLGLTTFVFQFFSTVADRYVYVGMFGLAIAVAGILNEFPRAWAYSIFAVLLVIWCVRSFDQAGVWQDTPSLYDHELSMVKSAPQLFRHYITYAKYCDDQADIALNQMIAANNDKDFKLGQQKAMIGQTNANRAIKLYEYSLAQFPMNGLAYDFLSKDFLMVGKLPAAIAAHEKLLELNPIMPPLMRMDNVATLHFALGLEYSKEKHFAQAQVEFERSLRGKPDPDVEQKLKETRPLAEAQKRATTRP